ncbi:hypothetical protein AMTRI_Chr02g256150 [Amborella trichopoda]
MGGLMLRTTPSTSNKILKNKKTVRCFEVSQPLRASLGSADPHFSCFSVCFFSLFACGSPGPMGTRIGLGLRLAPLRPIYTLIRRIIGKEKKKKKASGAKKKGAACIEPRL